MSSSAAAAASSMRVSSQAEEAPETRPEKISPALSSLRRRAGDVLGERVESLWTSNSKYRSTTSFSWLDKKTMRLPEKFKDADLSCRYDAIWESDELLDLEHGANHAKINEGIPSKAMAHAVLDEEKKETHMSWVTMVQAGVCTPSYAMSCFREQLASLTLVSVLLAGFAISFAVSPPSFPGNGLPGWLKDSLYYLYGLSMLLSGLTCFAATIVAITSINRIANVCPTKSSVVYLCKNVFYPARHAIQHYIFYGIAFIVVGLVAAFGQLYAAFFGVPSVIVSASLCWWFIRMYVIWERETYDHNIVGDNLAAKDISEAAKHGHCINEGLVQ